MEKNGTYAVRSQMFECFTEFKNNNNFCYLTTYENERISHIHTYTQRETGVMTIGKICKADLHRN